MQPIATDHDAGLNAKIRFSLLGENVNSFSIDAETGEVRTAAILDRELQRIYYMTLMAQDSSPTEPKATAVNLTIVIDDQNDNSPSFQQSSFNVNIPDRIEAGQFVFGAHATDMDEGVNARIVYTISGKDVTKFTIDNSTGVIRTIDDLSANGLGIDKVYSLIVWASDQGENSKTTSAELTILLRPSHLFPIFSYLAQTQFTLPEDIAEGKVITKIQATSPKKGAAGAIKYAIAGGNVYDALKIDANSGELAIDKGLDYERSQIYEVWIEAADNDRPTLRSVVKLSINITDCNDNNPVMDQLIYHAEVLEEEAPPILVTKVAATDADSGDNGVITYRLLTDFDGTFEIDADSGEIFTTMKLDLEKIGNIVSICCLLLQMQLIEPSML